MADLAPHRLVMSVALTLAQRNAGTLRDAAAMAFQPHMPAAVAEALTEARNARSQSARDAAAQQFAEEVQKLTADELAAAVDAADAAERSAFAAAYANHANLAGLSLYAGFLGGEIEHEAKTWRLVYLDARLESWMLVPEDAIVVAQPVTDPYASLGERDILWVDSTANLITGSGPRTNDGRFLVGELTRAGDYAPATSGGTFSVASGLLCEATTPGCCMRTRTRC